MNEQAFNNSRPSPNEKLANFYASLADDVLDGYIDIDEETTQRAIRVVRAVTAKKVSSGRSSYAGVKIAPELRSFYEKASQSKSDPSRFSTHHRVKGWFARWFGLNIMLAGSLTAVALMSTVFGWGTLGLGFLIDIPIAVICGFLTFLIQREFEKDDFRTAAFKGVMVAVLLAIPFPLAPFVLVPAGIIQSGRRKKDEIKTSDTQRTGIEEPFWRKKDETKASDTQRK